MSRIFMIGVLIVFLLTDIGCSGGGGGGGDDDDDNDDNDDTGDNDTDDDTGDDDTDDSGSIQGYITDSFGAPLADVEATAIDAKASTTTGVDGAFTLAGLTPDTEVIVRFTKTGYTTNSQTVAIHGNVASTVRASLKKQSAPVTFDAGENLGVFVAGNRLAIPADSLVKANGDPVTGEATLRLTPLDVTTGELDAFPGNFRTDQEDEVLETFGLAEIVLEQNGQTLNLAPSATATVELRLADDTTLEDGDTVSAWFFDEEKGYWEEEGSGTVSAASDNSGDLSWTAEVGHFSFWNIDMNRPVYCATGKVVDKDGDPVDGAFIKMEGVNYRGEAMAWSNLDGDFCINMMGGSGAFSHVTITKKDYTTIDAYIQSTDNLATCPSDDCEDHGEFTMYKSFGLNGKIVDNTGAPMAGIAVWSSTSGNATVTDAGGEFCLNAKGGETAVVYAKRNDFEFITTSKTVDVPEEEEPCSGGGGDDIGTLTLGDPYCFTGRVLEHDGTPMTNIVVAVEGPSYSDYTTTDASGEFCLDVAPGLSTTFTVRHPAHPYLVVEKTFVAPDDEASCEHGGCGGTGDLQFPNLSCVHGFVQNADASPNTDVRQIWTSEGNLTLTDEGEFCIDATADTEITVFGYGCIGETVTTPATGTCGDPETCAEVVLIVPGDEPAEVLVPAGSFFMGCEPEDIYCHPWSEHPRHEVLITNDYYIDTFEVTNAQFAHFLNNTNPTNECETYPCVYSMHAYDKLGLYEDGGAWLVDVGYEDRPVIGITWFGAVAYCENLGKRLPTEAEWEKAAKGADEHYIYPWGETLSDNALNYWQSGDPYETGTHPWTTPVGYYDGTNQGGVYQTMDGRSPYGAHDMAGNLFEWCSDWWNDHYYENEPVGGWVDPLGPETGECRILRGGSWATTTFSDNRTSFRWGLGPQINISPTWADLCGLGFRCVHEAE